MNQQSIVVLPDPQDDAAHNAMETLDAMEDEVADAAAADKADEAYFQFYDNTLVHSEIFKDSILTDTYKKAIEYHKANIQGKVVLDIGCGTGLLSLLCARVGARKVYAVEASDKIAEMVEKVVDLNEFSGVIQVMHEQLEKVELSEKVDIIVSDWMGNMLFCENMLPTIIHARDRWLNDGGLMLPSAATLFTAPFNLKRHQENITLWRNGFYGMDLSPVVQMARVSTFKNAFIERIRPDSLMTLPMEVKKIDCYTITKEELDPITFSLDDIETIKKGSITGFGFWFKAFFKAKEVLDDEAPVLSTSPFDSPTHWEQTLLYFPTHVDVEIKETLKGSLRMSFGKRNRRLLEVEITAGTKVLPINAEYVVG